MALTNEQYQAIMRVYEERQSAARELQQQRRRQIDAKTDALTQAEASLASLNVARARARLLGLAEPDAKQRIDLETEKKSILTSLGYPENYLDPVYTCKDCKDTGYIGNRKCHCFEQMVIDLMQEQSNIKEIIEDASFDDFDLSYYSAADVNPLTGLSALESAERALRIGKQFVQNFGKEYNNLLITGTVGVGKTYLSQCIAHEVLRAGHSVVYFSAARLFEILSDHSFHREDEEPETVRQIQQADLLIIDDLGSEYTNSYTITQLFTLMNERMQNKRGVVISTNLDLDGIRSTYSERISSRIQSSYTLLPLFGKDIRLEKKYRALTRA